jgi:hypothetical protein
MTTIATTSTTPVAGRATLGALGGALWMLLPAAWAVAELEDQQFGSLSFFAVAAADWIFLVLAPALIVVGLTALRTVLGTAAGRVGGTGMVFAALGLGAMALGNGIEVGSMSAGGGEVALGHAIFLIGFLVSIVGWLLVGITVIRKRRAALSRVAGWILVLALPLGIGIGMLGSVLAPENDAGFWAAISVPTGAAWLLLGRSLSVEDRTAAVRKG